MLCVREKDGRVLWFGNAGQLLLSDLEGAPPPEIFRGGDRNGALTTLLLSPQACRPDCCSGGQRSPGEAGSLNASKSPSTSSKGALSFELACCIGVAAPRGSLSGEEAGSGSQSCGSSSLGEESRLPAPTPPKSNRRGASACLRPRLAIGTLLRAVRLRPSVSA